MNEMPRKERFWPACSVLVYVATGAKELIAEYWLRQGKKKGEKGGRKSDASPKPATRRPAATSVESTLEPVQATKKSGRDRQKLRQW